MNNCSEFIGDIERPHLKAGCAGPAASIDSAVIAPPTIPLPKS